LFRLLADATNTSYLTSVPCLRYRSPLRSVYLHQSEYRPPKRGPPTVCDTSEGDVCGLYLFDLCPSCMHGFFEEPINRPGLQHPLVRLFLKLEVVYREIPPAVGMSSPFRLISLLMKLPVILPVLPSPLQTGGKRNSSMVPPCQLLTSLLKRLDSSAFPLAVFSLSPESPPGPVPMILYCVMDSMRKYYFFSPSPPQTVCTKSRIPFLTLSYRRMGPVYFLVYPVSAAPLCPKSFSPISGVDNSVALVLAETSCHQSIN